VVVDSPFPEDARQVTRILGALGGGEAGASEELLPLVYEELRTLAAARMARLGPGQTLQATELVHEAYLRPAGSGDPGWKGRAHFFAAAACSMRDIVAERLRRRASLKRGGHMRRMGADTAAELTAEGPTEGVLVVEEALQELERQHPRKAKVVTLAFFGGLGTPEIAEVLGLSTRTVEREWRFAKAWLNQRLAEREEP
jgi:RNA polymerase sigma factor (TIGR02999 family)